MSEPIKELELEFSASETGELGGFTFKQVLASPDGYMYEITDSEQNRHYEVFRRIESPGGNYTIAGKDICSEPKVVYPKSNAFGLTAWCITDYDKAKDWFDELGVN